jgi:hypothetical protein
MAPPKKPHRVDSDLDREPLVSRGHRRSGDMDDDDDDDPLLPESDLYIERLRNELQSDLAGADSYERTIL